MNSNSNIFILFIMTIVLLSCQETNEVPAEKPLNQINPIHEKYIEYAITHFEDSYSNVTRKGSKIVVGAENFRVDTVLVISSQRAERIRANKFARDYEFFCKIDSIEYSPELESDSLERWLKRAEVFNTKDTVAYRVKFLLDYVYRNDERHEDQVWMTIFDKNHNPHPSLSGPLLEEEHFLVENMKD